MGISFNRNLECCLGQYILLGYLSINSFNLHINFVKSRFICEHEL